MRKFIALFLVVSIVSLSANLMSGERRGVELVVYTKDFQVIKGELIAVKKNSLLLKETDSGADITVEVNHMDKIKIVKESKTLLGVGLGFLAGVGVGAICGLIGWDTWSWAPHDTKMKYRYVAGAGAIGGLLGAGAGALIMSGSKTIQIEGKSESEIKQILEDLRKKARVTNFQ